MKNILNKNGIICVLDIGTYTTKCLLARRITNDKIELLGHGLCKTEGLKASKICNAEQVINTIKKTVEEAEKQANEKIENIIVSVCSNEIESTLQNEDKISYKFNNYETRYLQTTKQNRSPNSRWKKC